MGKKFRENGQKLRKLQNLIPAKFNTFKVIASLIAQHVIQVKCICENSRYLKSIIDNSMIVYDRIISVTHGVNVTNTI